MLSRLFRWFLYLVLAVVLLVVAIGIWIRVAPSSLFPLVENATGYKLEASKVSLNYWPLSLKANGLKVIDTNDNDNTLLELADGEAVVDIVDAFSEQAPFWLLNAKQVTLYVPEAGPEEKQTEAEKDPNAPAVDISPLLRFKNVKVANLKVVQVGQDEAEQTLVSADVVRQSVGQYGVDVQFTSGAKSLDFSGLFEFKREGERTKLKLTSDALDLTSLMAADPNAVESNAEANAEPAAAESVEDPVDWGWLATLATFDIELSVGEVTLNKNKVNNLIAQLGFDAEEIRIEQLKGDILLTLETAESEPVEEAVEAEQSEQSESGDVASAEPTEEEVAPPAESLDTVISESLAISGSIKPLGLSTQGADITTQLNLASSKAKFGLAGRVNVNGVAGNELKLDVNVEDLESVKPLVPASVHGYVPLNLKTDVATGENTYAINNLQLTFADSDLAGNIAVNASKDILKVRADLKSKLLHIVKAKEDKQEKAQKPKAEKAKDKKKEKVFSDEPLDWTWLKIADIDASLNAEKLQIFDAEFLKFAVLAKADQGKLRIKPFSAKFGGGGFDGDVALNQKGEGAELGFDFAMNGVDLESFGLISKEELKGGVTDIKIGLKAEGASSHGLASSLDGDILLTVQKATVMNDTFEIIGSDLVTETLTKLNPFAKSDPTTELECALVHFDVDSGVLKSNKQLVVETSKMEIVGDGKVDLNDETLSISISPSAKGGVGINVGSLVKFIKLGGTLSNPAPAADAAGLLQSGATLGAAISTGGLSLIAEGLIKQAANAGNACERAMNPPPPKETKEDQKAEEPTTSEGLKKAEEIEKAVEETLAPKQ